MSIRPKWLRDICSVLFSVYYIVYATEADEKVRRFGHMVYTALTIVLAPSIPRRTDGRDA